eukprot:7380784-Prymnesium_polylepis.8
MLTAARSTCWWRHASRPGPMESLATVTMSPSGAASAWFHSAHIECNAASRGPSLAGRISAPNFRSLKKGREENGRLRGNVYAGEYISILRSKNKSRFETSSGRSPAGLTDPCRQFSVFSSLSRVVGDGLDFHAGGSL